MRKRENVIEHYRWNVHPPWEHFSSLVREATSVREARSEIHRYHHMRASLYFAIGSIEAFLNDRMRVKMTAEGADEDEILKIMWKPFPTKARAWPEQLAGRTVTLPERLVEELASFNSMRSEITHAKAKDHSIYVRMDGVSAAALVKTTAEYIVRVLEAQGRTYYYWLHGWNLIGMNGNFNWPIVDSSNNQFIYALRHMGLNISALMSNEAWEQTEMSSVAGFQKLDAAMDVAPACERFDPEFPMKDRLCRRWWDEVHVARCGLPTGGA